MKFPTLRIFSLGALGALSCSLFAVDSGVVESAAVAPAAAPIPSMVMLADLRGEAAQVYAYGSWTDRINKTANGVVVAGAKGALGDGGMCGNLVGNVDMGDVAWIEVALGVGQTNEGGTVQIGLSDADGTLVTARLRVDQIVPQQPVWYRLPVADFKLVGGSQAGTIAGFDWAKVAQWHVQGEWATKKPYHLVVIAVRSRR